jgi:hypothetical protein
MTDDFSVLRMFNASHGRGRFDGSYNPVSWLIRSSASSYIHDSGSSSKKTIDENADARFGLPLSGIVGANDSVVGIACTSV